MIASSRVSIQKSEHSKEKGARARREQPLGRWWSVDPGEKHVGLAVWRGDVLDEAKEVTPEEFKQLLRYTCPKLIVIESFSLRSPKWTGAQSKQAVSTIKLIGYVEACMDDMPNGQMIEQQPSVRHVAQSSKYWRASGNTVPANSHARSAVAHGVYYLHFAKR